MLLKKEFNRDNLSGIFKGLVYIPLVYVKEIRDNIQLQVKEKGIINVEEYLEFLDLKEFLQVQEDYMVFGTRIISQKYLGKISDQLLENLKTRGIVKVKEIDSVGISLEIQLKIYENLKEKVKVYRFLDSYFVLEEFLQVLKVELRPIILAKVESQRLKSKKVDLKEKLSLEEVLEIMDPVFRKYIQQEDLKREIGEILYSDFIETVSLELQKTFKDSRDFLVNNLQLRKNWVSLVLFNKGIQEINNLNLREKLTRILLDVKVKEFLNSSGLSDKSFNVYIQIF